MPPRERFELAGQVITESLPFDDQWDFDPIVPEEEDEYVDGTAGLSHGANSHTVITLQADDEIVIPGATMLAWRAAHIARTPVTLVESYSKPGTVRAWENVIIRQFKPRGMRGSDRELYTYSLTLWAGPMPS